MKGSTVVDLTVIVEWEVEENSTSMRIRSLGSHLQIVPNYTLVDGDGGEFAPQNEDEEKVAERAEDTIENWGPVSLGRMVGQFVQEYYQRGESVPLA
jgi:hypothetical protein